VCLCDICVGFCVQSVVGYSLVHKSAEIQK